MTRVLPLIPLLLFLAACASSGNKVTRCGKGVYSLSASPDHPYGNYINTSRKAAFQKATAFCGSKGKQVLIESIEEGIPTHITFRCLKAGAPELDNAASTPPVMGKVPCN
jgi:hypothetical protein